MLVKASGTPVTVVAAYANEREKPFSMHRVSGVSAGFDKGQFAVLFNTGSGRTSGALKVAEGTALLEPMVC